MHLLDAFGEALRESLPARLVHEDTLHGDAALPGVAEAAGQDGARREFDVGVLMHDHGGVAAELESAAQTRSHCLQLPADLGAAGEGHHAQARVGEHARCDFVRTGQHADGAARPAGLDRYLAQTKGGERRLRRGLDDDGVAGSDGGRELVRHQVQREVEWRDAENGADGKAADQTGAVIVARGPVEGQQLAADALGFFSGNAEGLDGALDFGARRGERLAGFKRDAAGEIECVMFDSVGDVLEHAGAAPCREGFRFGKCMFGGAERFVGIAAGGLADGGDDVVIVGAVHLGGGFAVAEIARNDEGSGGRGSLGGGALRFGDGHRTNGSGCMGANGRL